VNDEEAADRLIAEGVESVRCPCRFFGTPKAFTRHRCAFYGPPDDEAKARRDLGYDGPRERVERVDRG
jgi:hypothetical protein